MRLEGAKELNAALKRIIERYPKERDRFLRGEAELLKGRAKLKTPVDTGYLRGSWSRSEPAGGQIEVYNNVEYAQYVEFGHRVKIHGHYTGGVVQGQFMLRDAVEESKEHFATDAAALMARIMR